MSHPITPAYAGAVLHVLAEEYQVQIELHHGVANDETVPTDTRAHHEEAENIARTRWNAIAFAINLIVTTPL